MKDDNFEYDDDLTAGEQRKLALAADLETERLPDDVLHRFHATIDRAAELERARVGHRAPPVHFWSFFWGVAVSAALVAGIAIGVWVSDDDVTGAADVPIIADVTTGDVAVPVAFQRSIQNYLRQSEREIARLQMDGDADRTLLIMRIIEQNRWFETAAAQNNSLKLARVLRAFEPILIRLAADDIAPEDAEALRAQLAFELNVMLTKLESETSDEQETTEESI